MSLFSVFRGLRIRLILLMTLVLFPLGLISIWQTGQLTQTTDEIAYEMLAETAEAAAAGQRALIQRTVGAASGLGAVVAKVDEETCRRSLQSFVTNDPRYTFAGFIGTGGALTCGSGGVQPADIANREGFRTALERKEVFVEVNREGLVTGDDVIVVNVPVLAGDMLLGLMTVSLRQERFLNRGDADALDDGLRLLAISTMGRVLDMSLDAQDALMTMPANVSVLDLRARAGKTFVAEDQTGEMRMYSAHEVAGDAFVILGSLPVALLPGRVTIWQALAPVIFPMLMWCASMGVAFVGLNRLVLRHLAKLRSGMRRFALGERDSTGLVLDEAPEEFEEAARAFNRMALIITEAEARHLTDLNDKELLLREVHHRVKNNLQMFASIMNLQARSANTQEARDMLEGLKGRVRALGTLHRSLYTEVDSLQVDARDVIAVVVSETEALAPNPDLRIESNLESVALFPDQAVPLSMWVNEALTNAVKYASAAPGARPVVKIDLSADVSGVVTLRVENTASGGPREAELADSTGLGTTLMTAFCRQLEGTAQVDTTDKHHVTTLNFAIEGFDSEASTVAS